MIVLAVDPGEHNGISVLRLEGLKIKLLEVDTIDGLSQFRHWLLKNQKFGFEQMVVEDWKTRPNDARRGSFDWDSIPAARGIGACELFADLLGIPLKLQQAAIKPVGYGYMGRAYKPGMKNVHHLDAAAHGVYWLVNTKHALPPSAQKRVVKASETSNEKPH